MSLLYLCHYYINTRLLRLYNAMDKIDEKNIHSPILDLRN